MRDKLTLGFTGTRKAITPAQTTALVKLIEDIVPTHSIDGMCVGADATFAAICGTLAVYRTGYPGYSKKNPTDYRYRDPNPREHTEPADTHFSRNRRIVRNSDLMIACPYGDRASLNGSGGTNYTIKQALKASKEIYIILPSGEIIYDI